MKGHYNIYSLNYSAKTWVPICSVKDTITVLNMPTQSLQDLTNRICTDISYLETIHSLPNEYKRKIIVDDLEFTFLGDLRWRHGTVYYGVQYSRNTQNVRILLFGTDNIHHSGQGTNPITKSIGSIHNELIEDLVKLNIDQLYISPEVKNAFITDQYIIGI